MRRLKLKGRWKWHVVLRGARRLALFPNEEDYRVFLAMLRSAYQKSEVVGLTHCLLTNHTHLQSEGSNEELTTCMRRLDRGYSGYFNEKYGLSGHAFEQEYFCKPIWGNFGLQRVARYIHLNPVRAGLVTQPEHYRWSNCAQVFAGKEDSVGGRHELLLSAIDEDPETARGLYREFVYKDLHRPYAPPAGKTPAYEIWQEQFAWIREYVQSIARGLGPIDPDYAAVYWAIRSGIPARVVGRVMGDPDGRRASRIAYRLGRSLKDAPDLLSLFEDFPLL